MDHKISLVQSEKSNVLRSMFNQYILSIPLDLNKISLSKYLERKYGITVLSINVLTRRDVLRSRKTRVSRVRFLKRAIVTLKAGDVLSL